MLDYFDLRLRLDEAPSQQLRDMQKTVESFTREQGGQRKQAPSLSVARQIIYYLGVVLGVILSPTINALINGGKFAFTAPLVAEIVLGLIIGLLIMPQAYDKLKLNPNAPFIIQFALFLQTGVFWQVALNLIGKASGAS